MSRINFSLPSPRHCMFIAIIIAMMFGLLVIAESLYNLYRPVPIQLDSELGWALKHNFSRNFIQKSTDRTEYPADYSTNELGLRTHGTVDSATIKLLVLGDSFTGDPYAGNRDMWYSVAAEKLQADTGTGSIAVWAGGAGGYGTYQELLLLRRLLKKIRPDVFVLQFCRNDFVNNHRGWEDTQILRSQKYRRPYAGADGNTEFSADLLSPIWRSPVIGDSRLFTFLDWLILMTQYRYHNGYGPRLDASLEERYMAEALATTSILLSAMRKELNGIPAYMVNCDGSPNGLNRHWMKLATQAGFVPLPEPSERIFTRKQAGETILHIDGGHLNRRGNRIFGEALAANLQKQSPFSTLPAHSKR